MISYYHAYTSSGLYLGTVELVWYPSGSNLILIKVSHAEFEWHYQ